MVLRVQGRALKSLSMRPASLQPPSSPERGAWDSLRGGWRQLYGSFDRLGVSVEMHDFTAPERFDWGRSFHPESVELCLNLKGSGRVASGSREIMLGERSAGLYSVGGAGALRASRIQGEPHRFATVELSRKFIAQELEQSADDLDPILKKMLRGRPQSAVGAARAMNSAQQTLVTRLAIPPVAPAALPLWYQSKVLEIIAQFCFEPAEEMFCTRQKRLARERTERACEILRERLVEPPSLEELGREVGVSQFHLSRIFSEEMRVTIPQFLRRIRMERAAELLREGRHNVTEAAFAVGYASLGHFSKSFCEVIGCCPALYPSARTLLGAPR